MTTTLADVPRRGQRPDVPDRLPRDELAALTEVGLAIVRAQLDVDALCELVYTHVARLVDANSFHLGLFHGDAFDLKVWVQDGERRPPASFPGAQEAGIIGWMRSSQVPLLVRDFEAEMETLPARPSYVSQRPPRSAVFVPLVAGDAVVGSMAVQHPEPDIFDEQDLRILEIIANQAASAIVHARLYATARRRAEQLAAIVEVGRAITAVLDLDQLIEVAAQDDGVQVPHPAVAVAHELQLLIAGKVGGQGVRPGRAGGRHHGLGAGLLPAGCQLQNRQQGQHEAKDRSGHKFFLRQEKRAKPHPGPYAAIR
jgi:transcriptional regulator with GAF, ATPase, and Fis domain